MANNHSIFSKAAYRETRSFGRAGRVELLSQDIANELNTYKNFGVFPSYNDTYVEVWRKSDYELVTEVHKRNTAPGAPSVRSIFNKNSSVMTGNFAEDSKDWQSNSLGWMVENLVIDTKSIRMGHNAPLIDNPETRKQQKLFGITVRELVQASQRGYFGRHPYSYADFMYCKYLNRIPNNYLITLRRYAIPPSDSIMPSGYLKDRYSRGGAADTAIPMGTMVTWLGAPGNSIGSILKYEYNMPFEEVNAKWEDVQNLGGGQNGILNTLDALVDPAARQRFMSGESDGTAAPLAGFVDMFVSKGGQGPYRANNGQMDQNKIYGPIDRVKSNYRRSGEGLKMTQKFDLVFEYELKAYNGINPRQALIDLLGNILTTTYTTGGFWGGGYRSTGMQKGSVFNNLSVFKVANNGGSFTDMVDAFTNDVSGGIKKAKDAWQSEADKQGGNPIQTLKSAGKQLLSLLNNIGGVLIGGLLNKLGRPAKYHMNSLVSEQPVGLWHITIGNPHRPIMSLGNMILKNTVIEHSGPLGMDDFPTNLKVTCSFERGKPRDQVEIEHMYTSGELRAINSMDKKVADMYKVAVAYNDDPKQDGSKVFNQMTADKNAVLPVKPESPKMVAANVKTIPDDASEEQKKEYEEENKKLVNQANELNVRKQKEYAQALADYNNRLDNLEADRITKSGKFADTLEMLAYHYGNWETKAALMASKESDKGGFHNKPVEEMTNTEKENNQQ